MPGADVLYLFSPPMLLLRVLVFKKEIGLKFHKAVEIIQMIYFLFMTPSKVGDHTTLSVFVV